MKMLSNALKQCCENRLTVNATLITDILLVLQLHRIQIHSSRLHQSQLLVLLLSRRLPLLLHRLRPLSRSSRLLHSGKGARTSQIVAVDEDQSEAARVTITKRWDRYRDRRGAADELRIVYSEIRVCRTI